MKKLIKNSLWSTLAFFMMAISGCSNNPVLTTDEQVVNTVLKRGKINSTSENEVITDVLVVFQQEGKITPAQADSLSAMIGVFEKSGIEE
jgi:hypothetical protein